MHICALHVFVFSIIVVIVQIRHALKTIVSTKNDSIPRVFIFFMHVASVILNEYIQVQVKYIIYAPLTRLGAGYEALHPVKYTNSHAD